MDSVSNQRSFSIVPWVVVWVVYLIGCELLKFYDETRLFAGGIVLLAAVATDLLLLGYALWLTLHATAKARLVFGLFVASCLFLLGLDVIYHSLYSILQIPRTQVPVFWLSTYNILYLMCLFLQIGMWAGILSTLTPQERKTALFCVPFTVIVLVVLMVYIFAAQWGPAHFTLINFYDGLDEILEWFGFVAATMCLLTAKNKWLTYLALGYLIIRSTGFMMDFRFFSQTYGSNSIVEALWVLGAIFMIYALAFIKKDGLHSLENPWVELPLSLRSKIIFWGAIGSVLAFTTLTVIAYFFNL